MNMHGRDNGPILRPPHFQSSEQLTATTKQAIHSTSVDVPDVNMAFLFHEALADVL